MSAEPHSLTREQAASLLVVVRANAEGRVVPASELWDLPALGPAIVVLARLAGGNGQAAGVGEDGCAVNGAAASPAKRLVRREDVLALLTAEPQGSRQIADRLGVHVQRVQQHLSNLRAAGLATNPRRGAWTLPEAVREQGRAVGGAPTETPAARAAAAESIRAPERSNGAGETPAVQLVGETPAIQVQALPWAVSLPAKPPPPRPTTTLDERDRRLVDHLERTGPLRVASIAWALNMRTGEVTRRLRRLCYTGHVSERDGYWEVRA